MKRICKVFAVALSLLVSACGGGESTQLDQVTAKTLENQPAGEALVLDLTGNGTIYDIAADIDHNRLRVRTSEGEIAVSDFVKFTAMPSGTILVGTLSDMNAAKLGPSEDDTFAPADGGVVLPVKCSDAGGPQACWCVGRRDCSDMNKWGMCASGTKFCGVGSDGHWGCTCWKKR